MEECKLASLSHPPITRVVDSTKLTHCNSQSESLPDCMRCLSPTLSSGDMKAESMTGSTDYTGVEPKARLNRSDDIEERTEWKTLSEITQEEQDRLSNMKEEVEECEERQSVKMEREDGVMVDKGLGREQEKARDEQKVKGVAYLSCQNFEKNGVKSEYGQQDMEEVSNLVTACLLNQPRVLIRRITGNSESLRPFARKHQSASSENGLCLEASHHPTDVSRRNQDTGQTVEAPSEVFACSQCPFVHTEEVKLHQHLKKVHADKLRETLVSGRSGATVTFMEECKLASLSHPPITRVVDSTKLTHCNSQSESLPDYMRCLSPTSSSGDMKAESMTGSTDYTGVEPKARLNRSDDIEERTEWKTLSVMTQEEDRLSNMKEEVEECEEGQSVKMEREDGVMDDKGLGREQQKARDEQKGKGVDYLSCQNFEKNGVKSEYGQQDMEEVSNLVTACLLNQPRVVIGITGHSESPRPFARKRQSASSENGLSLEASHNRTVISPRNQNTGQTVEASSEVFACSQCPFVHTEEVNLHQHLEKVHAEQLRETVVSGRSGAENPSNSRTPQCSKAPETLPIPTQSHTGTSGAHKCPQCGKSFLTKSRLTVHQKTHTEGRPYLCSQCGKNFKTKSGLIVHTRTHTGKLPYLCSQCGKSFVSPSHLTTHQRTHTGECPYHCSQCGKSFKSKKGLIVHTRTHTGERPYHCSHCGKNFKAKSELTVHTRTHTGECPYQCSQCGRNFKAKSELTVHTRTHTGECPYQCSQCGRNFKSKTNLTVHTRTHSGERPYRCSQCEKNFKSKSELKIHTKIHSGERPYHCSQCGKSYLSSSHLSRHQLIHTGERPYQCSQCGKNYKSRSGFTYHQQIHTGECPYHCSQCGKSFKSKKGLILHTQRHLVECPYHCSHCEKSFKSEYELTVHTQSRIGEWLYRCSQCGKNLKSKSELSLHTRRHIRWNAHTTAPSVGKNSDQKQD
ncbi:zinc finger protein 615-like [Conger conger]|uniref:zinc finger protein 615-like n=1 Tax=Conger conger TaxID=82655 RepID=UPI002A5AED13|nr:zinc finger protein 615-like [Conger conger]XP_061098576.1 zinc finger protein 615-like [Conger conger]XP_061098577.1 zinc finger protein 615-like [Conger conger]XP_061098578.1 zinc finger protein 615-like [Conger conger]